MENLDDDVKGKRSFFKTASFGKRIEFWIIAEMLRQGFDVYVPLVDDKGIDAVIRKPDGNFAEVQIKARSANIDASLAAGFSGIKCERRNNYWFIFYSSLIGTGGTMWLMKAEEFMEIAYLNRSGKNAGTWSLWLSGCRRTKTEGCKEAYAKKRFDEFICPGFNLGRLLE